MLKLKVFFAIITAVVSMCGGPRDSGPSLPVMKYRPTTLCNVGVPDNRVGWAGWTYQGRFKVQMANSDQFRYYHLWTCVGKPNLYIWEF